MTALHLYSGNLYGGVETLLVTLARCRHLCPEMEPEFALCFRGRLSDELTATGVKVHDLGPVRLSRPWSLLNARGNLKKVLRDRRPDVAIVHMGWTHAAFASPIKKAGVKLVHMVHSQVDRRHWINRWAKRTQPDKIIANSRFIAQDVEGWFPGIPVFQQTYPVEAKDVGGWAKARAEVRAELQTSSDMVVILQASRLEDWKGQRVHIQALGQLRDLPNWKAWFAGGPQMSGEARFLEELKALTRTLGISDRVQFLGQRSDVQRLMCAADIYCQPNTGPEPFGIVFVEALYAGLPVITSNFGGGAEIVTPECGMLTEPGDAHSVAEAVAKLIQDPARRSLLASAGPKCGDQRCNPKTGLKALRDILVA